MNLTKFQPVRWRLNPSSESVEAGLPAPRDIQENLCKTRLNLLLHSGISEDTIQIQKPDGLDLEKEEFKVVLMERRTEEEKILKEFSGGSERYGEE